MATGNVSNLVFGSALEFRVSVACVLSVEVVWSFLKLRKRQIYVLLTKVGRKRKLSTKTPPGGSEALGNSQQAFDRLVAKIQSAHPNLTR